MIENVELSSVIGVRPIFSPRIGVDRHHEYRYVLLFLAILFGVCWVMAFCDLIGFDNWL